MPPAPCGSWLWPLHPPSAAACRRCSRPPSQGRKLWNLPRATQRDLLALFTRSAAEFLDDWFESDPVRAVFGFDAVVGNYASPYTPGSAYVLLHHVFGEVNGKQGAWGHAIGGMGAITQAMAAEAKRLGVEIRLETPVAEVTVESGRTTGVVLASGEKLNAKRIVSGIHPQLLYGKLIDASHLDADFNRRITGYKSGSGTLRMNVALSELPDFTALPGAGPHLGAGIIMAPSLDYMDRAYQDARTHGFSREPIVEMLIPSTLDDSLAPKGQHVASLFCQHFAPQLPEGRSWENEREAAAEAAINVVNHHAPNFKASILGKLAAHAAGSGAALRPRRRGHLPRCPVAGPARRRAARARPRRLPRSAEGTVHVRLRHPPRWRRHRPARPQRGARNTPRQQTLAFLEIS